MPTTALAHCTGCHAYNDNRRWINPSDREGYYMGLCRVCESTRNRARRAGHSASSTATPGITSEPLGLNRRYGIEIECILASHTARENLRLTMPTGWRLKGDGSLSAGGCEIVSPRLQGADGLAQLKTVLDLLEAAGATVNRSCGMHVHHEVQDIGRAGLINFVKSWAANQELIDWLVSPSRRQSANTYCRTLTPSDISQITRWSAGQTNQTPTRYKTCNVAAFAKYGTVEIRQHQGTLSYRKIEAWVKLTQGMLDSVAGRGRAFGRSGSLRSLFEAQGSRLDEDTSAYLLGRAMQLRAPASILVGEAVAA